MFYYLLNRINKLKLENISVIMESTGIYHRSVERFFLENHFKVFVTNALYCRMYKRNLRKTKTDKFDCISFTELFFATDFKENGNWYNQRKINFWCKQTKYFDSIISIFGLGEFTASLILAELKLIVLIILKN